MVEDSVDEIRTGRATGPTSHRKSCAVDLHPRVFGPGKCASTLIAKAPVLLTQVDLTPTYRLFVRPSLASYVIAWLIDGIHGARAEAEK